MSSSGSVVVSARPQIQHFATFCCFSVGFKSVCSGARFDDEPPAAAPPPSALRGELRSGLGAAPPRSASCSASLLLVALLQAADALQQRALVARRLEVAPWSHHSCSGGLDARFPMFRFSRGVTRNFRNISEKFASEFFRIFRRATLSNQGKACFRSIANVSENFGNFQFFGFNFPETGILGHLFQRSIAAARAP